MRDQSSRERVSTRADEVQEPDYSVREPTPVISETPAKDTVAPEPNDAPALESSTEATNVLSRDEDIAATLDRIATELARLKTTYGAEIARSLGERAITLMRRA